MEFGGMVGGGVGTTRAGIGVLRGGLRETGSIVVGQGERQVLRHEASGLATVERTLLRGEAALPEVGSAVRTQEVLLWDLKGSAEKAEVLQYSGGAYGKLDRVPGWERHHMPADSVTNISKARGPAIQMEAEDHFLTSSYGNSSAAQKYRRFIQSLVDQQRFRDAMAHEIKDVRHFTSSKYNEAIQAMLEYAKSANLLTK